jgi:prepilin-type processing-associated H-X9-DG protein
LDENEATIEDGVFLLYAAPADFWQNGPAHRHNQGANLSFADGHCEHWRWKYPNGIQGNGQTAANAQDLEDLRRLQAALPPAS